MKAKTAAFTLTILMIFSAAQDARAAYVMYYWLNFYPYRNEYRMDFQWPRTTASYRVWFIAPYDGQIYEKVYDTPPTGVMWLTCNGTYNFDFYNSAGVRIGYYENIVTTQIVDPPCNSYPEQTGQDDLGARSVDNGNGTHSLFWNRIPGAATYDIYKDGQLIGSTGDNQYTVPGDGSISIVARDGQGNVIGESHLHVPRLTETDTCITCATLAELLSCPEWDVYMGELTQAIRNALPTLPEWRQIAEQFVDAFDQYFGPVPTPPSVTELEQLLPDMPQLETSVPEANIQPEVPSEYNQTWTFDITDGPEIEVTDESEPFQMYEPDEYINADEPGRFVYPGDSRNHSDGIKQPDAFVSPYPQPVPTLSPPGSLPPSDVPQPAPIPPADMPQPGDPGGVIPIPRLQE